MAPIAVPKAVELFNRLADLRLGDHEQAMGMLFELRKLTRSQPADPTARVGLASACHLIGYRHEALEHLAVADTLWAVATTAERVTVAALHGCLGEQHRALTRAQELFEMRGPDLQAEIAWNCALTASRYGDIEFLKRVRAREEELQLKRRAGKLLQSLDEFGLTGCFSHIQAAVSQVVAPYAMGFDFGTSIHPDDGRSFLTLAIQIDASQIHRLDLEDLLSDRLDALARERNDIPENWWWRYFVTIESAPRHPSIPAAPRRRRAA